MLPYQTDTSSLPSLYSQWGTYHKLNLDKIDIVDSEHFDLNLLGMSCVELQLKKAWGFQGNEDSKCCNDHYSSKALAAKTRLSHNIVSCKRFKSTDMFT